MRNNCYKKTTLFCWLWALHVHVTFHSQVGCVAIRSLRMRFTLMLRNCSSIIGRDLEGIHFAMQFLETCQKRLMGR